MRRHWPLLGLSLVLSGYGIGQWELIESRVISAQESLEGTAAPAATAANSLAEQYAKAALERFLLLEEQQQKHELQIMLAELKQSRATKRLKELQAELRKLQSEFPATAAAQVAGNAADLIESPPMARIHLQDSRRPTLYSPEGGSPAPTPLGPGRVYPSSEVDDFVPRTPVPDSIQPDGFGPSS